MLEHVAGEAFAMIDPSSLQSLELPLEALGTEIAVAALGLADADPVPVREIASGEALRPPSPVRLSAEMDAVGELQVRWVRRSRAGWAWLDAIEAPVGESIERYRVRVGGSANAFIVETTTPEIRLTAAQLAALGPGIATVTVTQLGDYAESRAASISITLS